MAQRKKKAGLGVPTEPTNEEETEDYHTFYSLKPVLEGFPEEQQDRIIKYDIMHNKTTIEVGASSAVVMRIPYL